MTRTGPLATHGLTHIALAEAVAAVQRAGGSISSRGEFAPGWPYAHVTDPDGYDIEIWYE